MNKKIIISPTYKIAKYWCREMRLGKHEVMIITPDTHDGYRGIKPEDVYAYLFEEPFDFPERTAPYFERFCQEIERYLESKGGI